MYQLTRRKPMYSLLPDAADLIATFEAMINEVYFSETQELDVLARGVDIFSLYAFSYEETGDPFLYSDQEKYEDVVAHRYHEVVDDVSIYLDHHRMYYYEEDVLPPKSGSSYSHYNIPMQQVW